jgi:uncharacterized protein with PQ loop repeat
MIMLVVIAALGTGILSLYDIYRLRIRPYKHTAKIAQRFFTAVSCFCLAWYYYNIYIETPAPDITANLARVILLVCIAAEITSHWQKGQ